MYTLPVPGCDGKTAAQIFEAAGCVTPAAPSCAACLGGPRDTFARMNEPEVRGGGRCLEGGMYCVSSSPMQVPVAHSNTAGLHLYNCGQPTTC